jgi:predicted ester cyclase
MANEQLIKTARALIDAFHQRDLRIWEQSVADNLIADYPGMHGINKELAYAYNKSFFDASDDLFFDVQHVLVQGNQVVFQALASATMKKPLVTPQQTYPGTGKSGKTPFVMLVEIKDGKIVREQTVWNQLEVFIQWGLLPMAIA